MKTYYILVNFKGERLYQYGKSEYIDVIECRKRDAFRKGITARIATIEEE